MLLTTGFTHEKPIALKLHDKIIVKILKLTFFFALFCFAAFYGPEETDESELFPELFHDNAAKGGGHETFKCVNG